MVLLSGFGMSAICVSAPGSLMISGEHAVVYGHAAIVAAIGQRITVSLTPRDDQRVVIKSALAHYESDLCPLIGHSKLTFVIEAIRQNLPSSGFTLQIDSHIDSTVGFGSSAAVTVATIAALLKFRHHSVTQSVLHRAAHQVILAVQGRGSGADIAASIWGGMLAYRAPPNFHIHALPIPPAQLSVRYAGYKTSTDKVLAYIASKMQEQPEKYQQLYIHMGHITEQSIQAAMAQDWSRFYQGLSDYQSCLSELGVCDDTQRAQLQVLENLVYAAKISGSGLGDCIMAFAQGVPPEHSGMEISPQGVL